MHNYLPTSFVEEIRQKQEYGINTVQFHDAIMTPPLQPLSRRKSTSSICSTDLAAMYFDSLPPTPDEKIHLQKSLASLSPDQSSHDDISLKTPISFSSCNSTICEKLSPIILNQPYSQYVSN